MAEPKPVSKADVDPNFELQLRKLKEDAAARAAAWRSGGQVLWMRPLGWNGNPFDYEGLAAPFSRAVANQQFLDAVVDAAAPGVTGDLIATTLMVDYLGTMERAFRNRLTMNRCRRIAHAAGRAAAQGSEAGGYTAAVEYLRRIVKRAKGPQ